MRRYWDLTELERARLDRDQVESYLDMELMERGVLRPEAPLLEPLKAPTPDTYNVFVVKVGHHNLQIAFDTAEDANKFLDLDPDIVEHDWRTGRDFLKLIDADEARVVQETYTTEQELGRCRAALEEDKKTVERNQAALSAYEKALDVVNEATRTLLDDWYNCRARETHLGRIRGTYADYLVLSQNQEAVARKFLAKVFTSDDIEEAIGPCVQVELPLAPAESN